MTTLDCLSRLQNGRKPLLTTRSASSRVLYFFEKKQTDATMVQFATILDLDFTCSNLGATSGH